MVPVMRRHSPLSQDGKDSIDDGKDSMTDGGRLIENIENQTGQRWDEGDPRTNRTLDAIFGAMHRILMESEGKPAHRKEDDVAAQYAYASQFENSEVKAYA